MASSPFTTWVTMPNKLVSYPVPFSGDGPDLFVSVFGMLTHVNSDDKQFDPNGRYYDGVTKRKLGAELTYSFLSWLARSEEHTSELQSR